MKVKLTLYLIILAGLITSCTRDSTELETDTTTEQKNIHKGETFTAHLGLTTGSISIHEEPSGTKAKTNHYNNSGLEIIESPLYDEVCGGGSESIFNNPEFENAVIGIQIRQEFTKNKDIIAGGLFELSNPNLKNLSVRLVHGKNYNVEVTLIKNKTDAIYFGDYGYPFYRKDLTKPAFTPMENIKDWKNPEKLYEFYHLQQSKNNDKEFTPKKMYCCRKSITANFNDPKILLDLTLKSYKLTVDFTNLPDDVSEITVGLKNYLIPLFNIHPTETNLTVSNWFPTIHGFFPKDKSYFGTLYAKMKKVNGDEITKKHEGPNTFEHGKSYTIKADFQRTKATFIDYYLVNNGTYKIPFYKNIGNLYIKFNEIEKFVNDWDDSKYLMAFYHEKIIDRHFHYDWQFKEILPVYVYGSCQKILINEPGEKKRNLIILVMDRNIFNKKIKDFENERDFYNAAKKCADDGWGIKYYKEGGYYYGEVNNILNDSHNFIPIKD